MGEGIVLLTGPRRGGKASLLRAIRANLSATDTGADTDFIHDGIDSSLEAEEMVEMGGGSFLSSRIMLDNKYYTTELQLWRSKSDSSVILPPCSATTAAARNVPEGLEGVVVAFDLSVTSGREWRKDEKEEYNHSHLFEAMAFGEFAAGQSEILLRLCVGTKADLAVDNDGLYQRRKFCMEWCVDNGFEYIEANCLKPWEGGDIREKEGIPRVVEALHCGLWSKARLKRRQKQRGVPIPLTGQNTEPETAIVNGEDHPHDEDQDDDASHASSECIEYKALTDDDDDDEGAVLSTEGGGPIRNTQAELHIDMQVGSLSSNMTTEQHFEESFIAERGKHDNKEDGRRPEDEDNDEADGLLANDFLVKDTEEKKNCLYEDEDGRIEAFDRLLSEVQGIREEAKTLLDHQRRERASQMALRMLNLLGVEDSGDDSESST